MNKFEKFILDKGIFLDGGAARQALVMGNDVFKIPLCRFEGSEVEKYQKRSSTYKHSEQVMCEQNIYDDVELNYPHLLSVFPKTTWFGRVCMMEHGGRTIEDIFNEVVGEDCDHDLDEALRILYENGFDYCGESLKMLLDFCDRYGGFDIVDNLSNICINKHGKLKIVDWGCLGW